MEIIKFGTEDITQLSSLNCCWPPGVESLESPALHEEE